jgi:hypothetical protein
MKRLIPILLLMACIGCTSFDSPVPAHHKDHYYVKKTTTFLIFKWEKLLEFQRVDDGRWLYVGTRLPVPPEDNPTIQRRKAALRKREEEQQRSKQPRPKEAKKKDDWGGGWR